MSEGTWNVLLPRRIDESGPESIRDFATFTNVEEYGTEAHDLCPHVDGFDAVILRGAELTADVLDAATNLKIISKHGAGLDNVDVEAATRNGIVVSNTPGANARAVSEHAISLLLATRKRLLDADEHVRSGGWDRHAFASHEFRDATLGTFGFGNVARSTAEIATGLGMSCIAYDPYVSEDEFPDAIEKVSSTAALFERADAVSVHAPLTDETQQAISDRELDLLSGSGLIVNTARGEIIDEDALVDALADGRIGGAGLDVLEREPPPENHPLLEMDSVVLTPHVGGLTSEALERMSVGAATNVRTVYEGNVPQSAVNAEGL